MLLGPCLAVRISHGFCGKIVKGTWLLGWVMLGDFCWRFFGIQTDPFSSTSQVCRCEAVGAVRGIVQEVLEAFERCWVTRPLRVYLQTRNHTIKDTT